MGVRGIFGPTGIPGLKPNANPIFLENRSQCQTLSQIFRIGTGIPGTSYRVGSTPIEGSYYLTHVGQYHSYIVKNSESESSEVHIDFRAHEKILIINQL